MQHTLYTLTPIDQTEGLEDGRYVVTNGLGFFEVNYDKQYSFYEEMTDCSGLTHYLRPAPDNSVVVDRVLLMEIKGTLQAMENVSSCNGTRQLATGLLTKLAQMGK